MTSPLMSMLPRGDIRNPLSPALRGCSSGVPPPMTSSGPIPTIPATTSPTSQMRKQRPRGERDLLKVTQCVLTGDQILTEQEGKKDVGVVLAGPVELICGSVHSSESRALGKVKGLWALPVPASTPQPYPCMAKTRPEGADPSQSWTRPQDTAGASGKRPCSGWFGFG